MFIAKINFTVLIKHAVMRMSWLLAGLGRRGIYFPEEKVPVIFRYHRPEDEIGIWNENGWTFR